MTLKDQMARANERWARAVDQRNAEWTPGTLPNESCSPATLRELDEAFEDVRRIDAMLNGDTLTQLMRADLESRTPMEGGDS